MRRVWVKERFAAFGEVEEDEGGVGGLAGRKRVGIVAAVEMMATYSVMFGISDAFVQRNGFINCPSAPPKGFAREATAVAVTRPLGRTKDLRT